MKEKKHHRKPTPGKVFALVLACVIVLCIAVSVMEGRYDWAWDISVGNIYTLSDETVETLESLNDDISIHTLYSLGNYNKTILTLLEKYRFYSDHITVSNIDPSSDRLQIKEYEKANEQIAEGSIIVMNEDTGRFRVVDVDELYVMYASDTYFLAENRITDAIRYTVTGDFRRIYFTAGHRETALEDISVFVKMLSMQNYIVEEYDYLRTTSVPDPLTDVIVTVSPEEDFSETEAQSIKDFVANGGTYILLYDHAIYDNELSTIRYLETDMPQLNMLMKNLGIELGSGIIVGKDAAETGFRNTTVELSDPEQAQTKAVFSECTYLQESYASDMTVEPLLVTSANCELLFQNGDRSGTPSAPYTVGMLAQSTAGNAAVFATSSFIADNEVSVAGNAALIEDILRISTPGYPRGVVQPKRVKTDELNINSMLVKVILTICVVVLIPCVFLCCGIAITRRRKKRAGK